MELFVARQPIFTRLGSLYGYELLFRSGLSEGLEQATGHEASLKVIDNAFFVLGLDSLTGGKRALAHCPTPRPAPVCCTIDHPRIPSGGGR